jgi:DNA-binding MarR family transcriptional regulator
MSSTATSDGGALGREPTGLSQGRYDVRILYALRRIVRAVSIDSRILAHQYHITGPQLICLHKIVEKGPVTATAIAKAVHLSPSTMVGILDRLGDKGLVQRQRDTEDRRKVYVAATDSGRSLAAKAPPPLLYALSGAMRQLPEKKQAIIATSLERIVKLLDAEELRPESPDALPA